jgi:hypothetical protein
MNTSYIKYFREAKNISEEEQEAIDAYFGTAFGIINRHLRKMDSSEQAEKYIKNIDSVMKRYKIRNKVVYRGVRKDVSGDNFNKLYTLKINDIYTDKGYLSTTPNYESAVLWSSGDIILKLNLKSPRGIIRSEFASRRSNEDEILLDRNIKFKVIDKYYKEHYGHNVLILEMRMI